MLDAHENAEIPDSDDVELDAAGPVVEKPPFWRSPQAPTIAAGLIVLATVLAYINSLSVPFVFDDEGAIVNNPTIRDLGAMNDVLRPTSSGMTVDGRPLLNLSLAINYAVSDVDVWSYHLVNLAIHVLGALLLFGIVRRTFLLPSLREKWEFVSAPLAFAVALFWALHPLQTESVTYVIQRAESLVGLFYLLTLYCVIRGATRNLPSPAERVAGGEGNPAETQRQATLDTPEQTLLDARQQAKSLALPRHPSPLPASDGIAWYVLAALACLAGMASKEIMVSAPLIVLLYDRAFLAGSFRETLRRRWGLYLAMFCTWALLGWLVSVAGSRGGSAGFDAAGVSWQAYLNTQFGAIAHYLWLSVWPFSLVFDYGPRLAQGGVEILPWAVVVGALATATLVALIQWPKLGFLGAWFFAILAPSSSFIVIATQPVAEHRMYLPLAAIIAAIVVGGYVLGQRLVQRGVAAAPAVKVAGGALVLLIGGTLWTLTFERNDVYGTPLALWGDTVAKTTGNTRAMLNYGRALIENGKYDEAVTLYTALLELVPDGDPLHNAEKVRTNLGIAFYHQGQLDKAIAQFRRALELDPKADLAYTNYGNALFRQGKVDEAAEQYEKALAINPNIDTAESNLGLIRIGKSQLDEAISHFHKAVTANPENSTAQENFKSATAMRESIQNDLTQRRDALMSKPKDVGLLNDTAWLLATNPSKSLRNGNVAITLAERANAASEGKVPAVLGTLAAAYAEAGRFSDAVETAQKAIDLAAQQNKTALVESLKAKIELYRAEKPFRTPLSAVPAEAAPPASPSTGLNAPPSDSLPLLPPSEEP